MNAGKKRREPLGRQRGLSSRVGLAMLFLVVALLAAVATAALIDLASRLF